MSSGNETLSLTICRGLQGSGKSTWAINQVIRSNGTTIRVSRDDLRYMQYGVHVLSDPRNEKSITKNEHDLIRDGLTGKRNVIVDGINLSEKKTQDIVRIAHEFDGKVQIRFQDFPVPVATCVERDKERAAKGLRHVGEDVIRATAKRHFVEKNGMLPNVPANAYEKIFKNVALQQDTSLPSAWIVDFDGTIAEMGDRNPYDWHKVDEDEPLVHAIKLVQDLKKAGHTIIILSGRDAVCRQISEDWLNVYEVPYDMFYMRAENDNRSDSIIKKEIMEAHILGTYFVAGCLDDRKRVVEEYQNMGLFVAQVANGMF